MRIYFCQWCVVSVTIFQTFSCHDVGPQDETEEYMAADYSVSCASERYAFAMWWAVAMLFVYPIGKWWVVRGIDIMIKEINLLTEMMLFLSDLLCYYFV